jgi:hypothetical protein
MWTHLIQWSSDPYYKIQYYGKAREAIVKKGLQEADGADDTYTASIVESRPLVQKLTALPELLQKQQEQKTNKKSWYLVGKTIITCHYTQEDHNQI